MPSRPDLSSSLALQPSALAMMLPLGVMGALMVGHVMAGASPGLLDYLKNPAAPVVLEPALPDRVVVNGKAAPQVAPPAAPLVVAAKAPEALPEPAPAPAPTPAAVPEPAPEPLAAQPEPQALAAMAPEAGPAPLAPAALAPSEPGRLTALFPAPSPGGISPQPLAALPAPPVLAGKILPPPDPSDPATPAPEGRELAVALQTFLAGLTCYAGKADGSFGPGSRGALGAFYDANPTLVRQEDASAQAWRDVQAKGVAPCPEPFAPKKAAPVAKASAPKEAAPQAAPQAAAKPKPAAPKAAPKAEAPKAAPSMSDLAAAAN